MSLDAMKGHFECILSEITREKEIISEGHAGLTAARTALQEREKSIDERERIVSNREKALEQVREIAASRKARITVLEDALEAESGRRIKAEADRKGAITEKDRLEGVCASLLAEKKAMMVKV